MPQNIIQGLPNCAEMQKIIFDLKITKFLLVCDNSFHFFNMDMYFNALEIPFTIFDDFQPNPTYNNFCSGLEMYKNRNCDGIVAIGGGSAIDIAKCIKLYSKADISQDYFTQELTFSSIPLIVFPTTAGTGSESTRYAVIYKHGEKQSISHESIIPTYSILVPTFLKSLPDYQKKCTLLDALCQAIESWWSVNSTMESQEYSKQAIRLIMNNMEEYIKNVDYAAEKIMLASNYSGRAINVSQTTAVHAMSYKLTSLYNLPHGHAVAICLPTVWKYMVEHTKQCIDPRGEKYLVGVFEDIASTMGAATVEAAIQTFDDILYRLGINPPVSTANTDLIMLAQSVNITRLKNNPVLLDELVLYNLYTKIIIK